MHSHAKKGNIGKRFKKLLPAGNRTRMILFVGLFALVGGSLILLTRAAGPYVALEPENATLAGSATKVNDATASGGSYLKFGEITTPPTSGYPDATNTGVLAGVTRTNSGSITTTSDGQVIQNLNINGSIYVNNNNVHIKNVKITNPGGTAITAGNYGANSGTVIEDCDLDGTGNTGGAGAVGIANFTIRRCNIHNFGEGIDANGGNVIEDNYLHDFTNFIAQGAHQDGIQVEWPNGDIIRHNTIIMGVNGANANIHVSGNTGGALIENNLLASIGGNDMSLGKDAVWRNNKISVLMGNYPTAYPDCGNGPCPHITRNLGSSVCGTTYYDSKASAWNSPTAGQYVEKSINSSSSFTRDSAC